MTQIMHDILKLSIPERILMVEAIWNSIANKEGQIEISSETKNLLEDRLDAHESNPNEGSSWEDVKVKIKNRF